MKLCLVFSLQVTSVKQQLEKKLEEFKQNFSRTEQALQSSQTKESELRRNSEVRSREHLFASVHEEVPGLENFCTVFQQCSSFLFARSITKCFVYNL